MDETQMEEHTEEDHQEQPTVAGETINTTESQ